MKQREIQIILKEKFGDAVGDWSTPEKGDEWIEIVSSSLNEVCHFLRNTPELQFDSLRLITGLDRGEKLLCCYHLYSYVYFHDVTLHVEMPRDLPRVSSVASLWPAAEWHEREAYDMLGIIFEGHSPLKRILLPEDWDGFPLRKDYKAPESYHGLTNE